MKVSIIGAGYIGLVTGVCMAEKGNQVVCVDMDKAKDDMIERATPPIYAPGLEALLRSTSGRTLRASTDLRAAVLETEITLIAVGTPFDGHEINLSFIRAAARQIGTALRNK